MSSSPRCPKTLFTMLCLGGLMFGSGCHCSAAQRGQQAFNQSDYVRASKYFHVALKEEMSDSPGVRARFWLYSGLNHLALGNAGHAVEHLARARQLLEQTPSCLSAEDRGRLMTAWTTLGSMPGEPLYRP